MQLIASGVVGTTLRRNQSKCLVSCMVECFSRLLMKLETLCVSVESPALLSREIRDIIPVPLRRVITSRSSNHSHPSPVSLPTSRTLSHKSSLRPRKCNLWSVLSSACSPKSYSLPSFKSKTNKVNVISLSSYLFAFFSLPLLGLCIGYHGPSPTGSIASLNNVGKVPHV